MVGSVVGCRAIFNACSARHADGVVGASQLDPTVHEGIGTAIDVGQIGEDFLCPTNGVLKLCNGRWVVRANGFLEGHLDGWAARPVGLGQVGTRF